jgi:hypothetical protein
MNPAELKVKSKALEWESKQLRKEFHKELKNSYWNSSRQKSREAKAANFRAQQIWNHRKNVIGKDAHIIFIARAFLKGQPASDVLSSKHINYYKVANIVSNYTDLPYYETKNKIMNWVALTL